MAERDKSGRSSLKLVQPTKEELDQWRQLIAEHPWQLTLEQFLKRVASEYGFELCGLDVRDPTNKSVHLPYLRNPDGKVVHLPGTLRLEDQLDEIVTASLCRRLGIPPEHFGLLPEEPLDEELDWDD